MRPSSYRISRHVRRRGWQGTQQHIVQRRQSDDHVDFGSASDILAPDLNLASSKNRRNTFEQTIQVLATGARAQLCRQHKTRPGGLEERTPACEAGQEEMMFIVLFQNQTGQSSIYES